MSTRPTPRICCLGDVIVDIVVHLDRDPERGTDTPAKITSSRGGSAAGVAVAASVSGGVGRFVGCVGQDRAGEQLVEDLRTRSVETFTASVGTSGTIVVLVDRSGQRSFLTDRGAAIDLSAVPEGCLDDVDLLHIPAYSFAEGPLAETSEYMVGMAVEMGIPVSISTSSVAVLRRYGRENFLGLLDAISPRYVIANADEYRFLLQGKPWFRSATYSVITNGGKEAVVRQSDGSEVRALPKTIKPVDTTGAGDAFTGAFLVSQLHGDTLVDSLSSGHALAEKVLLNPGFKLD